jgi:methylenetetrahydrofolate reductase (NADPH)
MKSKFAEALASGRTVLTAECLPPRATDAGVVRKLAATLPANLDAVVVADNPEDARGSALACAAILTGEKREAILSIVTRDRNRVALESDVLGASALGVHSFLTLSGTHPWLGVSPKAARVYDIDSVQFSAALSAMTEQGVDFNGVKLDSAPQFTLGAVAHPYLRPLDLNILRVHKKIEAGAKFLLTQAIFDLAGFTEWMDAMRKAGLDKNVAILASVLPLPSADRARQLQAHDTYGPIGDDIIDRLAKAPDPAKAGITLAAQVAATLKTVPGVRGIHILSGGCESSAALVLKEAGLA